MHSEQAYVVAPGIAAVALASRSAALARLDVLDEAERAYGASLAARASRDDALAGRVLLRLAVAALSGTPAGALDVRRRCARCGAAHGVATLPGLGWSTSLAHADGLVAVAVTSGGAVGIDVERSDAPVVDWVLAPAERAVVALDPGAFARVWTAKEALLKATGEGVHGDLTSVEVDPTGLTHTDVRRRPALAGLRLHAVAAPPPYDVTLATAARDVRVRDLSGLDDLGDLSGRGAAGS